MAETDRCGRRKQRNPKRKNFEDEVSNNVKQQKTNTSHITNNSSNHHDNIHDTKECSKEETITDNFTKEAEKLKEKMVESSLEHIPASTEVNSSPKKEQAEVHSVVMPCKVPSCVGNSSAEEDKIQEYLGRSDTAVIYPEPVSDPEARIEETEEDDDDGHESILDEDVVLKCIYCSQPFGRVTVLKEHMKGAHPEKPIKFQCPNCDETFQLKSHLDKHLALHSPTSQSCKVCNKTFANVYRLQRHMISHDESTDLRKFKCPECGKAFKFKHHLKEHIRIHSGEKPFECPNCRKRFSHSGSYSSHMTSKKCWVAGQKVHTSERMGHIDPNVTFSQPHVTKAAFNPAVHMLTSVASGAYPRVPFVHIDPTKGALPAYFSPPGFLPYTAYPMFRHSTPIKPVMPIKPEYMPPPVITPISTQISPDVNSNTQLKSMQNSAESKPAPPEISKSNDSKNVTKPTSYEENHNTSENVADGKKPVPDITEEKIEDAVKEKITCHFCDEVFNSAVDQHQHERYLCKANKDIHQKTSLSDSARGSPCSSVSDSSHRGTPNGSISAPDTDPEDEMKESRNFRMRSLITDEQLAVLKAHYEVNPRPRKFELIRIGNEIKFPKRVVQVWFQNMRARDRRLGKNVPYFPSMARFKNQDSASMKDTKISQQSFIPIIPNSTMAHCRKNEQSTPPRESVSEEQPLDLSVHSRTPTPAHMASPASTTSSSASQPKISALNLCTKAEGQPETKHEGSLQNSAIYKYFQQEGMIPRHFFGNVLATPQTMFHPFLHAHAQMLAKQESTISHRLEHRSKSAEPVHKSNFTDINRNSATPIDHRSQAYYESNGDKSGQLMIDESHDEDSNCSSDSYSDGEQYRQAMADATLNLATLAEVSLSHRAALLDSSMKSKRMRKKSWRQMEAEEVQIDLEDSLLDEDHPLRKKRRSWKGHKIDADEGMYACDQCKKMFSKQSSLARHKYEHSGARPFTCEICGKAFKHKHHLTEHRRLHSGEKPFECKKCGKRFSHSGSYSQHMNHRYKYCKPLRGDDGFSSS